MNWGSPEGRGGGAGAGPGRADGVGGVCRGRRGDAATRGMRNGRCGAEEGEAGGGRRWCCFLDGEPLPSSSPRAAAGGGRGETRGPGGPPLGAVGCGGGYSRCAPASPPPRRPSLSLSLPSLPHLFLPSQHSAASVTAFSAVSRISRTRV